MKKKQIILNVPDTNPPVDNTVVDFRNWKAGPNCNVKCEEKKIIIYGFELNQYIIKSRYTSPRTNIDVQQFARDHSTFKVSNLVKTLNDNNVDYITLSNIPNYGAGDTTYYYRGLMMTIGIRGNFAYNYDYWSSYDYPWDFGIPSGYLKNPNKGFRYAGFNVDGTYQVYNNPNNCYTANDDTQFDHVRILTCANGQYRITINGAVDGDGTKYIDCYDNPIILELIE
ncbi:MAG: hypothetical protein KNU04_gp28 [crAssphage sp. isolate ctbg_1]|uniref:Uncharacterized protein n=1 Tax=crAssphage sp. isolate ctbg_1 TaxID=2989854 RepID=A0A345MSZ5_9CAUD|nr:MAG: hypothetical protein KNU04_gp28 [crAssphage sp. isolate ctbg_1]AXH74495.1 MAG: hypothetical protein [crAssphage sp. isolate ctbg_1]